MPRQPLGARGSDGCRAVHAVARKTGGRKICAPATRRPAARDDFGDSVWFSLSVGRRQNAEPRWLIPMLCRTGNITKREIGAIKMQPEETFVQIAADWADRFLAAIGPDKKLQNNIVVKRLDGTPDLSRAGYQPPSPTRSRIAASAPFDRMRPKVPTSRNSRSARHRTARRHRGKALGREAGQAEIRQGRTAETQEVEEAAGVGLDRQLLHMAAATLEVSRQRPPFVILWRSKERSDAAQTIGSMPCTSDACNGPEFCAHAASQRSVTAWILGSARPLRFRSARG